MRRVIAALWAITALAWGADENPLKTLRPEHPRLILRDGDLDRIRAMIQQHPLARKIHADLLRDAEKIMTAPTVEYKLMGPHLLAQSRHAVERIYTPALHHPLHGK